MTMKEEMKNAMARERKMKRTKTAMWILIAFAALISIFFYIQSIPPPNGKYDTFAKCIANTSTTFYGAFWCPHCEEQKQLFGSSKGYLPYVECSTPDGQGQLPVCTNANITGYPTWVLPDGTRLSGAQSLATLAQKTGCALP